jgi:hypothetical protein
MKARSLVACFFAAFGLYLVFTGLPGLVWAFATLWLSRTPADPLDRFLVLQSVIWLLAPLLGASVFFGARALGALTARAAGLADDAELHTHASARELMALLLAVLGAYLVITHGAALARVGFLLFRAEAASRVIAEHGQNLPDGTALITHALGVIGGALLVRRNQLVVALVFPLRTTAPSPAPTRPPDPA